MIIGIDFDNTIVCYDNLFYETALEKGLIPAKVEKSKTGVRDYLRRQGREESWTELQGFIYGPGIIKAKPFPGVLDFFKQCKKLGIKTYIISHKTKFPFIGEKYDLHFYAWKWLADNFFFETEQTGLSQEEVFFELTKEEKASRIDKLNCTNFIDDLPEIFAEQDFPKNVEAILFDPQNRHSNSVNSWINIISRIKITFFLQQEGINNFELKQLFGGKNNKAFLVDTKNKKYFLKAYFQHRLDSRDRLQAEFSFCSLLWNNGIHNIPKPYLSFTGNNFGLYEFIEGRILRKEEISENLIRQAIDFFTLINKYKSIPQAESLPPASEACFSIAEHLDCVEKRVARLKEIEADSEVNRKAIEFVDTILMPAWQRVAAKIKEDKNLNKEKILSKEEKCLSPSDFGFHNALLKDDGKLIFLDFEYAGWDDPAKIVCDFFCQPEVPVPLSYYNWFAGRIFPGKENLRHLQRTNILLPVYKIKWCCILLNEFMKVDLQRRKFAQDNLTDLKKEQQLQKTRQYFQGIREIYELENRNYK